MKISKVYQVWHVECPHCEEDLELDDYCYPGEEIETCWHCEKQFKIIPEDL